MADGKLVSLEVTRTKITSSDVEAGYDQLIQALANTILYPKDLSCSIPTPSMLNTCMIGKPSLSPSTGPRYHSESGSGDQKAPRRLPRQSP